LLDAKAELSYLQARILSRDERLDAALMHAEAAIHAMRESAELQDDAPEHIQRQQLGNIQAVQALALQIQAHMATDHVAAERLLLEAVTMLRRAAQQPSKWRLQYDPEADALELSVRRQFGCPIERSEDGKYRVGCSLAHLKDGPGFSIGAIENVVCSICRRDPLECEHIPGDEYDGVEALLEVTELKIDHISLVKTPKDPYTRHIQLVFSQDELVARLPPRVRQQFLSNPDAPLRLWCDLCMPSDEQERERRGIECAE